MFTVWGGQLTSVRIRTAGCRGRACSQQLPMLPGISATEGESSYGNPGEGEERSAEGQGRGEWKCSWTKGVELEVGVGWGGGRTQGRGRGCSGSLLGETERHRYLFSGSHVTSCSHSLRSKLTHSHAFLPPSPGSSHDPTTFLSRRIGF